MLRFLSRSFLSFVVIVAVTFCSSIMLVQSAAAADHADSTSVAGDPGADVGDVFAFLDPNDNSKVILIITVAGFIVPSEALNLSFFPSDVMYRLEIENTGDAVADRFIDVTFSPQTSRSVAQTATVAISGGTTRTKRFNAPATLSTLNGEPNPFNVTTNTTFNIKFFAGMTDDPFYFDIAGFGRFVSSVLGGNPDPTRLERSRDSFAGYNTHSIGLSVPASMLRGTSNVIGVNGITLRQRFTTRKGGGQVTATGDYVQVDRGATPAVATALIPFPRKNEYNSSTPVDDADGVFAGDIVATLTALGTNPDNIGILASVAVVNGDYLRLDLSAANTSVGFGERITTTGYTGFPNGRRTGDDTIDTLLYFITNQALVMGDNVNSNEVPLPNTFPYLALPNQPLENPAVDNTQN